MPVEVTVTAYQCRWCDGLERKPIVSLNEEEVSRHESAHRRSLEAKAKAKRLSLRTDSVLAKAFGSEWKNWKELYLLTLRLYYLLSRQHLMSGQSLWTWESGLAEVRMLRRLITDNIPGCRPYLERNYWHFPPHDAYQYIEASFSRKPTEGGGKNATEHLPELWRTFNRIVELTRPFRLEPAYSTEPGNYWHKTARFGENLDMFQRAIQRDVQTLKERKGVIVTLTSPSQIELPEKEAVS